MLLYLWLVMSMWSQMLLRSLTCFAFNRYPSHARLWLAPIRSGLGDQKVNNYEGSLDDWCHFKVGMKNNYGVDMSILTSPYAEEQKKYYLQV